MESKNEFKKMILKIICVIILIREWEFLRLILEYFIRWYKILFFYLWNFIPNYFYGSIPLHIRFNKIDRFMMELDI